MEVVGAMGSIWQWCKLSYEGGKIELRSELREESGLECDSELVMGQLVLKVNEFWKLKGGKLRWSNLFMKVN